MKSRRQRNIAVKLLRNHVEDTLSIVGIGRDVESRSYGVEWSEWDEVSAAVLTDRFSLFTEELQALETQLRKMPEDVDLTSVAGLRWREKVERMHVLSPQC